MVFSTDKKAPIGLNPVLLTITYANADGTITTQTETLGIHVKGKAKIGIASVSVDPERIKKGDAGLAHHPAGKHRHGQCQLGQGEYRPPDEWWKGCLRGKN